MTQLSDGLYAERYIKDLIKKTPPKELGARLQHYRVSAGFSIRDLADRAMLSKTSIVSLEQGKACRASTVEKVCRALNLHVVRLAAPVNDLAVIQEVGKSDWYALDELSGESLGTGDLSEEVRTRLLKEGRANPMLIFRNVPAEAGFLAGIVDINVETGLRAHPGCEFGYVLSGRLQLTLNNEKFEVGEGDSFFVPDQEMHGYGPLSPETVRILLFRIA